MLTSSLALPAPVPSLSSGPALLSPLDAARLPLAAWPTSRDAAGNDRGLVPGLHDAGRHRHPPHQPARTSGRVRARLPPGTSSLAIKPALMPPPASFLAAGRRQDPPDRRQVQPSVPRAARDPLVRRLPRSASGSSLARADPPQRRSSPPGTGKRTRTTRRRTACSSVCASSRATTRRGPFAREQARTGAACARSTGEAQAAQQRRGGPR